MNNDQMRKRSQELRKNATKEENKLWYEFLRTHQRQFNRQRSIGPYIVDFYCYEAKLVIELDGSQHYEEEGVEYDARRTEYLEQKEKLRVLRFSNLDINQNFRAVCEAINLELDKICLPSAIVHQLPLEEDRKEQTMKTVSVYTDGACSGNPGPGGWGAILIYKGVERVLSGGEKMTTNNRMELSGVIAALQALKEPCIVELWSDSKYVIDALEKGWAVSWRAKGWRKADKKPALNSDLWEVLLSLTEKHEMHYHWVKGHAENEYNNRCDALAVKEREKFV